MNSVFLLALQDLTNILFAYIDLIGLPPICCKNLHQIPKKILVYFFLYHQSFHVRYCGHQTVNLITAASLRICEVG